MHKDIKKENETERMHCGSQAFTPEELRIGFPSPELLNPSESGTVIFSSSTKNNKLRFRQHVRFGRKTD